MKIVRNPIDSSSLFPNNIRHRLPMFSGIPGETADALLAVCTDWIPPGEYGKARLVFPDLTQSDPLNNRWLTELAGANNEFEVYDLNASNFILEKELLYVVYDMDYGCFVPVGSTGLVRRATALSDYMYYGTGASSFQVTVEGAETTHYLDVYNTWSSEPVYANEKIWITYQPFDQPSTAHTPAGNRPMRAGRWYRIQRIPGDNKLFKAPTGGIPAAANTLLKGTNCPVWERTPGADAIRAATSGESINVYNWTPNVVCKDGDRMGIASYFSGGWFVIAEYCQDGSSGGGGGGGTTAGSSVASLAIEDYSSGGQIRGFESTSIVSTIDPLIIDYAVPLADLNVTIDAITLTADSTAAGPI